MIKQNNFKFFQNNIKILDLDLTNRMTHTIVLFEDIKLILHNLTPGNVYQLYFKQTNFGNQNVIFPPIIWGNEYGPILLSEPNSLTMITLSLINNQVHGHYEYFFDNNFDVPNLNVTFDTGHI